MDEILIEIETDKVVLEVPAPAAGVLAEIVQADGATVVAEQLIARIDTEGKAGRRSACAGRGTAAAPAAPALPRPAAASGKAGVAMPAAAKLMADNRAWPPARCRHRQGRPRDQGRRAGRVASAPAPAAPWPRRWPRPLPPAVAKPLPPVAAPCRQEPGRPPRAARADERACAPAWPSACCSRRPPTPS
jgi:2-oxoglutarate dehydrogenase E2 component (dihydrolipoamide succinyltransferase)